MKAKIKSKKKAGFFPAYLAITTMVAAPCAFAQNPTFTNDTYAVGDENSGPATAAVADFNGDGQLDMVCPGFGFSCQSPGENNGWGNTLTVLTNSASGSFGLNATLTVGIGALSVVAADLNGDSQVDLVSANNRDGTLTVLTNNGSGGFGFSATLAAGIKPSCVVATDLDRDGSLDLICANNGTNSLSMWTNNGIGGFNSNVTLTVGNGPYSVAAADVNGDGAADLITANQYDNTLTVLTNNGYGDFATNATIPVGNTPIGVVAADVTGEGKVDLISLNFTAHTLTVLTNNGSGGFVFSAILPVAGYPNTVAAGDFNGDGSVDLVCALSGDGCLGGDNTLSVLTNDGSGSFGYGGTLYAGDKPNVSAADLNADGKLDLICANYLDGTLTVLKNTSVFAAPTSTPTLRIRQHGQWVQVVWPSLLPGWSLQQNANLANPRWLPGGLGGWNIANDGTEKSLTLPSSNGQQFFRLIHP